MNLLKPGPGDLLDRLTILARKIVERPERKDLKQEFDELTVQFIAYGNYSGYKHITTLAALNAAIWQREDVLREGRRVLEEDRMSEHRMLGDAPHIRETILQTALQIQDLNDRRAALIAEINGTESEKLYK